MSSFFDNVREIFIAAHSNTFDFLDAHQLRKPALVLAGGLAGYAVFKIFEDRLVTIMITRVMPTIHNAPSVTAKKEIIKSELKKLREERGKGLSILEIGTASGLALHILPEDTKFTAMEPLAEIRPSFNKAFNEIKHERRLELEQYLVQKAENMSNIGDNTFDAVIMTYVFCSVSSVEQVLKEVQRVLKPGGKLYALDHVRHHFFPARLIQTLMVNPITTLFGGNCHWTRYPYSVASKMNFSHVERETFYFGFKHFVENSYLVITK